MIAFLLRADPSGSIDAECLGALRRSTSVLAFEATEEWSRSWADRASVLVLDSWSPDEVSAALAQGRSTSGDVSVVLPSDADAAAHTVALSGSAWVRDLTARHERGIRVGERVPATGAAAWLAGRPLLGWVVMVTRAEHQAPALESLLHDRGAATRRVPVIRLEPPREADRLDRTLERVENYDWIVFTSSNAVTAFRDVLFRTGRDARDLAGIRIAAIGPGTAGALETLGVKADVVPGEFVAESLLDALRAHDQWQGRRVLLPRAEEAREVIPRGLTAWGATVDVVPAYRTVPESSGTDDARRSLDAGAVDLVTFTASSTVRAFTEQVGSVGRARAVAIGPVTAATAAEEGIEVAAVAERFTMEGLVDACVRVARAGPG